VGVAENPFIFLPRFSKGDTNTIALKNVCPLVDIPILIYGRNISAKSGTLKKSALVRSAKKYSEPTLIWWIGEKINIVQENVLLNRESVKNILIISLNRGRNILAGRGEYE
jgi:hypothetical protein